MKGRIVAPEVIVSTFIATAIYVMFAIAYISMLALTERSAAHYVRSSKRMAPRVSFAVMQSPAPLAAERSEGPAAAA
ncbi:MAG: hypothetical protein D9V44_06770 [Actinobacteria bacterium]|nr:MAG: hypothetical protein D9V44_06770 [Actinomycetota bacterium]